MRMVPKLKEDKMMEDYRNSRVPFSFMNTPTFYVMARRVLKFAKEANQNTHDSYQQQGNNSSGHRGGEAATKITASLRPTGEKSRDGSSHHIRCKDCGNDFPFPSESNRAKHFAKKKISPPIRCFGCIIANKLKKKEANQKCPRQCRQCECWESGANTTGPEKHANPVDASQNTGIISRSKTCPESENEVRCLEQLVESQTSKINDMNDKLTAMNEEIGKLTAMVGSLQSEVRALSGDSGDGAAHSGDGGSGSASQTSSTPLAGGGALFPETPPGLVAVAKATIPETPPGLVPSAGGGAPSPEAPAGLAGGGAPSPETPEGLAGGGAPSPEAPARSVADSAEEESDSHSSLDSEEESDSNSSLDWDQINEEGRRIVNDMKTLLGGDGPRRVTRQLSEEEEEELINLLDEMVGLFYEILPDPDDCGVADYGVEHFRAWGVHNPERCCAVLDQRVMLNARHESALFTRTEEDADLGLPVINPRQFCGDLLAAIDGRQKQKGRRR